MPHASDRIFSIAKERAFDRSLEEQVIRYDQMAEWFRWLTAFDEQSLGPELARLQSIATTSAPRPFGFRRRVRAVFLEAVSPILGRLLKAASLASPYQAAYELVIQTKERQLQMEDRICAELAALNSKIDGLESEITSRRRTA